MEHIGTADWLNDNEIDGILGRNKVPGIILGKRNNDIINYPLTVSLIKTFLFLEVVVV